MEFPDTNLIIPIPVLSLGKFLKALTGRLLIPLNSRFLSGKTVSEDVKHAFICFLSWVTSEPSIVCLTHS